MNNEIRLSGIVGSEITADSVAEALKGMSGDIIVHLNSPGGSFFEGVQIFNELKQYSGRKIVKLGAICASAASYISCAGDEVIAQDFTSFMIHEVYSSTTGTSKDMRDHAKRIDELNTLTVKRLAERSKKSENETRQLMAAETWFYGQEIVDAGFADKLETTGAATERTAAVAQARQAFRIAAQYHPAEPAPATIAEKMAPRDPLTFDWPAKKEAHIESDYSMLSTESAEALLVVPESKSYVNDGAVSY